MNIVQVMPKSALGEWITYLNRSFRVVGPKPLHGQFIFDEIHNVEELDFNYTQTVVPPKKYIVPQREILMTYNTDGTDVKAHIEAEPTVVLGVHTCDLNAIRLLDRIFSRGFTDQHYQAHRENTFLVSYECLSPCTEESFCRSMGTATAPEGVYDLHMIDIGDSYIIEVGSDEGAKLLQGFSGVFAATEEDLSNMNQTLSDKWDEFPYRLEADLTEIPEIMGESYNSDYWQGLGDICLACGMCTQVCPTCYCFDVKDEVDITLTSGQRIRTWDSCQIDSFASVAGGHNFRETRAARQRHRFMRKGKYQYDATGMVGCVGCGRCATACLVDITPIKTFNELHRRREAGVSSEEVAK